MAKRPVAADTVPAMSHTLTFAVDGMSCASCTGRVERALAAVPGVSAASVNLANQTARVESDQAIAPAVLVEAVGAAGYPAMVDNAQLLIEGATCGSCVARIEAALKAVPGVVAASMNLATNVARVDYLGGADVRAHFVPALAAAGYGAAFPDDAAPQDTHAARLAAETGQLKSRALIAGVLTLPVFIIEMGGHAYMPFHIWVIETIGMFESWMLQFALITLVMVWPGALFYRKGFAALGRGAPDMNALVAVGTLAAWAYSTRNTFFPQFIVGDNWFVYFEAVGVIITLILVGRYFEARAKGRTGEAIRALAQLQVKTAMVEQADGTTRETPVDQIARGDILIARPGERIAADGVVLDGASHVDEAMLTGEPVPELKEAGGHVSAGTLNGSGALRYRAEGVRADTMLAQIIRLVERAQATKLPVQALVDKVTLWFVPAVMGLAVLTFAAWMAFAPADERLSLALVAAVSVLIIACPCAMGLATPTSIIVGTGRGAQAGILFRKGDALQILEDVDVVAFDKTGTLTVGKPTVTAVDLAGELSRADILGLVAGLEARSEHPIAKAIVDLAAEEDVVAGKAERFRAHAGLGASAQVDGRAVLAGSLRFVAQQGVDVAVVEGKADRMMAQGHTLVAVAVDGQVAALIGISDPVKPGAAAAIARLHALGLQTVLISGDNAATANLVGQTLGIGRAIGDVLPAAKVDAVNALKQGGNRVAFVGDGINDAPALAAADAGLAMGTGTDIAIEAADIVLVAGDPSRVADAIALSRATMRNIRQNLFWAFGYNAVLIPVAAGALYPFTGWMLSPMLAASAMALSSVFVLGNALRLRLWSPSA